MAKINRKWLKKIFFMSIVAGLTAASLSLLETSFLNHEGQYIDAVIVFLAIGITYALDYN